MRSRFVLLVIAILLIAGFAALNWSEVIRPSRLLLGPILVDAPLGAILLGLLALAVVIFALSAASMRTHSLLESRHHMKELEAQRTLADKAEASRFTELRNHIDTHLKEIRDRDAIAATELEKSRLEQQRELRAQLEQVNRTISARLSELEHRLESRFERMGGGGRSPALAQNPAPNTVQAAPQTPVTQRPAEHQVHPSAVHEQAGAQHAREQAHQAQMREEERQRDEQIREERERAAAGGERPAGEQSGWRRWF